jgi:hypothetical protein
MSRAWALASLYIVLAVGSVRAQAPTGAVAGVAIDASGAAVVEASIKITNRETGQMRTVNTSTEGRFSADGLPSGAYLVTAEVTGFKVLEQTANVEAGTTTTVNLVLLPGDLNETVTVTGAAPLLHYDQHQIGGVVGRAQIENLPLNGRNFLELAKLEPGVANPIRLGDNRTFVSPLGAGLQTIPRVGYTRVTIDGGNATTPSTVGMLLQVSQDVVQEFQMSTVNFDPATSLTTNGAINIVTRSGGNQYHGSGFSFYRDHNLAAYPALRRDPANPDPFFRRSQSGSHAGAPLVKDRAFFFTSFERTDQRSVVSVQPSAPEFAPLGGIFSSPYVGNLFSARIDLALGANHTVFARHTHDGNRSFAPAGPANSLPSAWSLRTVQADQTLVALTSVLRANVVNDARFSYFAASTPNGPAEPDDCRGCFGLGAPRIGFTGNEITLGNPGTVAFEARRSQLTDHLVWHKGRHRLGTGFEWEHATSRSSLVDREPAQITLWSPAQVQQRAPTIPLPASFTTLDDFLQLPLRSFQTAVGAGFVPQRGFEPFRVQDLYRIYASDTWNVGSRLTVNGGLSWSYEPNALNDDLTKPAFLGAILGNGGLAAPVVRLGNFSPTLGFAWTATRDGRTVVRGGAGRYFDPAASTNRPNLDNERLELSPLGTGRLIVSGANVFCNGRALDFRQPTTFTGAQLLACLPGIRADLLKSINPDNRDFSVGNIDLTKEGSNLYDPSYATPSAVHASLGVQRELTQGLVVSADVVWKHFVHTFINGIDYNRFDSTRGPVIPVCTASQRNDVQAVCSNGRIFFDTTIGRARYGGLLTRVEKRFAGRAQLLASYALGSYVGSNGTGAGTMEASGGRVFGFSNDDWFENYGPMPTDQRHILNVSGFVDLPRQFQVAFSVAAYSRPPFSAYINGIDFNGDGTVNDLLPGTRINQLGRGLDRDDLVRLVAAYNEQYAGRRTAGGQIAPHVTLPDRYSFDDNFFTQDMRVTRAFGLHGGSMRLLLVAEVFNLLNIANLVQYGGNLADPDTFGQPAARSTQVFGSGGPRAFQFGARVTF